MSKIFTLFFVLVLLSYVFLLQRFRLANPANAVNQQFRPLFLHSQILQKLFFLGRPGDNRFAYFSAKKPVLLVEVDSQANRAPDKELEPWLKDLVFETLGKKDVEVVVSKEDRIEDVGEFSDRELRALERGTRDLSPKSDQSYLHILYVSKSAQSPSNTGLTLTSDAMFILKDAIVALSERASIQALIEESTIRHEFGHLLGLEHVDRADCVMSERVEVYGNKQFQFENIPLDFCGESLGELRRLKEEAF